MLNGLFYLQAWIEASTKGGVLLFTASEIESATMKFGISPAAAGLLGGMGGGIAQAYATMGELKALQLNIAVFLIRQARFLHMHEDCGDHAS